MSSSLSPSRNPGPFTSLGLVTPPQNRRNILPFYSHPLSSDASLGPQDEFTNDPDSAFPDGNSLPPSHASRHGISACGPFVDDPSTDDEDGNPNPQHSLDLSQDLQDTNSLCSRPSVRGETYRTNDAPGAHFEPHALDNPLSPTARRSLVILLSTIVGAMPTLHKDAGTLALWHRGPASMLVLSLL